jgi:signal transduction histidine kinase
MGSSRFAHCLRLAGFFLVCLGISHFISLFISGLPLSISVGISIVNTFEALIGAHLLYKYFDFDQALWTERSNLLNQLQGAVRARDDVLAIVSHDLKNPLSAIFLNCQLLARKASLGTQDTQDNQGQFVRSQANRIQNDAERMRKLIDNLLDLAKIESGHFTINKKGECISSLLKEAVEMFRLQAADQSICLETHAFPDMGEFFCDRERILQVFSNLIGNALKFTPPLGKIKVSASISGDEVLFCVKDTGPGIPQQSIPLIFDRYWQGKRTPKQSLGLGLSIVKEIIEAHQGRIWVESQEGEGSAFYFALPGAYPIQLPVHTESTPPLHLLKLKLK